MIIVQLVPELNEGGVERGVVESSREYIQRGHQSYVISYGGKLVSTIEKDGGTHIQIDVCSKNIFTLFKRAKQLKKVLQEINPDIIHTRSRVPAWLAHFANKKLKIASVSTVHGFNSVSFYSKIMQSSQRVICVSNSIKEYIQTNYNTNESIITVIPRGIDTHLFNLNKLDALFIESFKKEYNLDNKFVVSSVGRVTQLKDYETFIKAIAKVKKTIPDIVALIVGGVREDKEAYLKSLHELIRSEGLEENIIFTGSQSKIAEVYALSDVVVSSSKKPESFGRAVAEAIAMNTAVVASNHGGVKDIILENENGFFFEIGDETDLASKIVRAKDLKFDGFNYISNTFSLENMIEKTLDVYKGLLKI